MSKDDAIAEAKRQGKNLVQIAFNPAVYPGSICKILDYAKFKYDQKKKQKEQNKKIRASRADLKELSFSIRIDDGDRATKIKHAREFLEDGDNVKLSIFLSKREMGKIDFAKSLLNEILSQLNDIAKIEKQPALDGRNWSCIVSKIKD
jgi:translation initiation factor IF-3